MVLAVVGSTYKLIHNRELFTHVEDTLCKKMQSHELDGVMVKDKVANYGRTCYREYVFPSDQVQRGWWHSQRHRIPHDCAEWLR